MSRKVALKLPTLMRLTTQEAHCIANMFKLYDYKSTGKIPGYLAVKVCKTIGITVHISNFSPETTIQELLLVLDQLIPEPEPALLSSLTSFNQLSAVLSEDESTKVITPQVIVDFMASLGRPSTSISEAALMLNAMLDYDNCADIPAIHTDVFIREMINFAKKTNAFKDYRP